MKELKIIARVDDDKIATVMTHHGFSAKGYTTEQVLLTIGLLENMKQQMLAKIEHQSISKQQN